MKREYHCFVDTRKYGTHENRGRDDTKESFWIKKLETLQPEGLNTQIDFI